MLSELLAVFCFVLLPLPFLGVALPSPKSSTEDIVDSFCIAYGCALFTLYCASLLHLDVFIAAWLTCAIVCLVRMRGRVLRLESSSVLRLLFLVLGCQAVLLFIPAFLHEFPQGGDPYFHLILADRIREVGHAIYDWMPYEKIPLNYPTASHTLLGFVARWTGTPVHRGFQLAMALFGVLTTAQVYSLVSRATKNAELALLSATAFAFTAVLGSLGYPLWGGLPNLIALYVFFGCLGALMNPLFEMKCLAGIVAVSFLGICFTHHHVMVTAGATLIWLSVYSWFLGNQKQSRSIFLGLVATAIVGSGYFLPYLLRTHSLGQSGIGYFSEDTKNLDWLVSRFGPVFFFPLLLGVLYQVRRVGKVRVAPIFHQTLLSFLGLFLIAELGGRAAMNILLGRNVAPFTPSRFLTDAVPLLSLYAGLFWRELARSLRWSLAGVVAAIVLCFSFNWTEYSHFFSPNVATDFAEACYWIREHSDADAVFINDQVHATYLSRRITPGLFLPTSEFEALAVNREMAKQVAAGVRDASTLGRQVVTLNRGGVGHRVLWAHPDGLQVVEVVPSHYSDAAD